ncbi:MAG: TonB-dependent receptor [Hyphomonadaceae bacterium]|nr:TonB-dependent receptor [Hyphomonadaceae bacterium]
MKQDNQRDRLFATTFLAGLALALPAQAQQASEPAPSESDAIIVTGSRIPQANLITTSPVTQVTAEDIKAAGVTRIEDLTNQLPQVFAAQGSNVSNGASGTAQVDLRGLGANRTLVLLNGRRMPYGSPNSPAADLNQIPGIIVESVEVLTGGGSAVYGSDAIAGVVNFKLNDTFEGFRIDGQYGFHQHNNDSDSGYIRQVLAARAASNPSQYALPDDNVVDGYSKEVSLMFGATTGDGRGNVTAYASYRSNDAILQSQRDYSACAIANPNTTAVAGVPAGALHWTCGGSGTSFPGYFYFPAAGAQTINFATGTFVPFTAANQYNFGPLNYYQRPDERYSAGAFAKYEINSKAEVYAELMFSDYRSVAQIAPSGNFFATTSINCDNPMLTAAMLTAVCGPDAGDGTVFAPLYIGRRNVEGGGRQDDLNYQSLRTVVGIRGELAGDWTYDLFASRSRVSLSRTYKNDFSITRLTRALDVVPGPGGVPTCRSVINGTDPACVPWNIFAQNGVTPAALNYLQIPLIQNGETIQQNVVGTVGGTLPVKSPGASSGLAAVFGIEYRGDELNSVVDSNFASGDGAGQGGPTLPLSGSTDAFEIFTEMRLPIFEDMPFAKLLAVDAAYRYSDYRSGIQTDTYKFGAEWAPVEDVRFRGSFSRAVRAPNVIELFAAQGAGLFNLGFDPCDNVNNGPGPVPAQCIGANPWQVTVGQSNGGTLNNPAGQYNGVFGGNPNLSPEEADTTTIGVVFTPSFVPGLSLSVDYFKIEVTDLITATGSGVLDDCYFNNNLTACANIVRNPANGRLWNNAQGVTSTNTNIGGLTTSGYDINAGYNFDIGSFGSVGLAFTGTYLVEKITEEGGSRLPYDCVGKWAGSANCGLPTPEWRHRARVSWDTPFAGLALNGTWRHIGEVHREVNQGGQGGFLAPVTLGTIFEAQDYFDFGGSWQAKDNISVRFGVNNALDRDPPLGTNTFTGAGFGNGNTFPQFYDATGRFFFIGTTLDF